MAKIVVNADDFGISPGVNRAVIRMFKAGVLRSASLMVKGDFADDALLLRRDSAPGLDVGLHFNLTTGKSVLLPISLPLLVNEAGSFKNGFVRLVLLSIFRRRAFLAQVEAELRAQISLLRGRDVEISHIDGHRHVHMIPGIFKIVRKVGQKEAIGRVRVINESLWGTLKIGKVPSVSGFIKWLILRLFALVNGAKSEYYFFSILHSCRVSDDLLDRLEVPDKYQAVEVMLHPSDVKFDEKMRGQIRYEEEHLFAEFRRVEAAIKVPNNIKFLKK